MSVPATRTPVSPAIIAGCAACAVPAAKNSGNCHALPYLAVPDLHAGGAAGLLRTAANAVLDWLAVGRLLFLLWLVESLLPAAGGLLDDARFPPGELDGPLPAAAAEGRRRACAAAGQAARSGPQSGVFPLRRADAGARRRGPGRASYAAAGLAGLCRTCTAHGVGRIDGQSADLAGDQHCQQPGPAAVLQVRPLRRGEPQRGVRLAGPVVPFRRPLGAHALRLVLRAAGGHLLLHVPVDELYHRFLLGPGAPRTESPAICHLRLLLPAAHGRADRAGQAPLAAVPAGAAISRREPHRRPFAVPRGPVQEAGPGQLPLALRGTRLRQPRRARSDRAGAGHLRLRLADLLRLQRLHRHGPRRGPHDGLPA